MMKFNGVVVEGQKRGKKLGFPTANILLSSPIPDGIYISRVLIDKKIFRALTFVGAAKTFGEAVVQSETWVMDFDQDLYGKTLHITLLEKIRENLKFESVKELMRNMEQDKKKALLYFQQHSE